MRYPTHTGIPAMLNQYLAPQSGVAEALHSPTRLSSHIAPHIQSQINQISAATPTARMPMARSASRLSLMSASAADESRHVPAASSDASTSNVSAALPDTPFQRLQQLGSIAIVNGGADGPTPTALDLLALGFGRSVAIACDDTPPNLLNDFPAAVTNVVATKQVGAVAAADTMFMLECSTLKTIQNAKYIKPQGRVVIAGGELHQVAEQVAALQQLRPDVAIFGHAASEFALYAPSTLADPVQASQAMASILAGHATTIVRPVRGDDATWISAQLGRMIRPGTAIPAPFTKDGRIERTLCNTLLASPHTGLKDAIEQLASQQEAPLATHLAAFEIARKECSKVHSVHRARRVPGIAPNAAEFDRRVAALGPTVVYGANGSIGSAILKSLAETGIALCGIMRKPNREFLRGFDAPRFDLAIADKVPDDFAARTAFITASTGWAKDAAGNIIFDRSRLLSANVNILTPIFAQLPADMPLVMVISNPCSEMAYLGWLLRPDLARNLYAHAGTDVTRQMNRVKDPQDTSHYGTAGPHSPMQVNWEMKKNPEPGVPAKTPDSAGVASALDAAASDQATAGEKTAISNAAKTGATIGITTGATIGTTTGAKNKASSGATAEMTKPVRRSGRIDPRIPLLGQMHQSRSRDKNSVTVPTAAASIFEAISIATHTPQSYARPLTAQEAAQMTSLMQQYRQPIQVSEGITPTLPRDTQGAIRWNMLTEALEGVPDFSYKLFAALRAMEEGRSGLLEVLAKKINEGRADSDKIDQHWIIAHRGAALIDAVTIAGK